jgi:hypothetical protein
MQALGYEGAAFRSISRETIDLLQASNIECWAFEKTIEELRRILYVYEERIGTTAGRQSLYPTALTRHFLTMRYTPGDIRQLSALIENDLEDAGIRTMQVPTRKPELTAGEEALSRKLARPETGDISEPRVIHDVDCVAGILMIRQGIQPVALEECRAVFATTSGLVARNTRDWFASDGGAGVPPVVHVRIITNLAWVKRPRLAKDYKVHEMVALCSAALRPSRAVWAGFLRHVTRLEESGEIRSDESAMIVASQLTDALLARVRHEDDVDSDPEALTLDEVVDRVIGSYKAEANQAIAEALKEKEEGIAAVSNAKDATIAGIREEQQTLAERLRRIELRADGRARTAAHWICGITYWLVVLLVVVGAVALIRGHPTHGGWIERGILWAVVVFVALEVLGILTHVQTSRRGIEVKVKQKLEGWLK